MESKGVGSYSEVIRQAIVFLHDKTFPDYVYRETPASQLKRSKAEQAEAWERMTDEEYVKDILQAPMFSNENGNSYAIVHTLGNSVMALKVEGIKTYMESAQNVFDLHQQILKNTTVESKLSGNIKGSLIASHGLIFPE